MTKHLKSLLVIAAVIALFSSCKKTTDFSIITGHKWVLSTVAETYSDSAGVSHNLMPANPVCQSSSYTEFQGNGTNSVLKLAYTYSTTNCPGQYMMPSLGITSWDIDPDNTVLYLNGSNTNGTGGVWYNIQSIGGSSMVLTRVFQNQIGTTGGLHPAPIYDTVTDTWTYTVK
jgi:hypothetical protein